MTGFVVCSLAAVLGAVPAGAAPCERAAAAKAGRWFLASPPVRPDDPVRQFTQGSKAFVKVSMDPVNPAVMLTTDGIRVLRTEDGGCTWRVVYELPELPGTVPDRARGEIASLDVARVGNRTRVLLALRDDRINSQAVSTVLVRSEDGISGWTVVYHSVLSDTPSVGGWTPFVRSAGNVAYAAIPCDDGYTFIRSTDGGLTWSIRTPPADRLAAQNISNIAVNPWQPDELWKWVGMHLNRSTDGAISWTEVDVFPAYGRDPTWSEADIVWPRKGGPARVLVLAHINNSGHPFGGAPIAAWSGDGGRTFTVPPLPSLRVQIDNATVAHLANGDAVVVARTGQVWRVPYLGRAPRATEWRTLARAPKPGCWTPLCTTAGSATRPGVVAMSGSDTTLQILTVTR